MKKFFAIFFILMLNTISFPQGISVSLIGGATIFQSPDDFKNSISNGGFGFKNSTNFGIKGKFEIPLLPLNFNASIVYVPLNSKESLIEVTSNLLSLGIGVEWNFIPGPISPYAAIDITFNSFGELEFKLPSAKISEKGFTRDGVAVGSGVIFKLLPLIDLDISAKYSVYNLIGKKNNEKSITAINLTAGIYFNFP